MAINECLSKINKYNLVSKTTSDGADFAINIFCLVKEFNYCNDSKNIPDKIMFEEILI